jgi:hypothetical protein
MQMLNYPIESFNRLRKCRVDVGVYKDEDEVDEVDEDKKKEYALFKIIELITKSKNINCVKRYNLMKKLKKITNNCNSIIDKIFFDLLPKYKLLSNMEESTYYKLNIKIVGEDANNTYRAFFEKHDLLQYTYDEKDPNKNYIFKLNANINPTKQLLVQDDNENQNISIQSIIDKSYNITETPVDISDISNIFFINSYVSGNKHGKNDPLINRVEHFTEILINNKEIADEYNKKKAKEQDGGNGKKQKVKSKPFKNKMLQNNEIFGKEMRIYKINGSKKEHVKYKGTFIPVSDYKRLIKKKNS